MPGSTTVSGTVTDADSQTWNNGAILFEFVPIPNYGGPYSWTGGAFNPTTTYGSALNSSGAYSGLSVPSNSAITPLGTKWKVTVTPQAEAPSFVTSAIISGTTQTLNVTPTAIRVAPGANVAVYATAEVANPTIGDQVYLIGTGLQTYNGTVWASVGAGASGSITVASGTVVLGTSLIASGASATVVTAVATGALTTDNLLADFTTDPTAITGYTPSTNGILTIFKWLTANQVNVKVSNMTGSSITPGAATLQWRVIR